MSNRVKVNLFAFITVLLWGSGFPFTRLVGDQLSAAPLGFVRCLCCCVVLIVIGKMQHIRAPFCRKDLLWFFLSGVLGFSAYLIFFNLGMLTLSSATGSIITAVAPILTSIGATRFFGEKINKFGWLCIASAFIGVVILLMWKGDFSLNIGAIWMLACAIVFAGYNLMSRKFANMGYTGMEIVTYSAVFGAIQTLIFLPQTISELALADTSAILAVIYLGILPGAMAYFFWNQAIQLSDRISEVTNYLFVNPLIAAIIGFLMLREVPDLGTYIGGIIIIVSVILFSTKGSACISKNSGLN